MAKDATRHGCFILQREIPGGSWGFVVRGAWFDKLTMREVAFLQSTGFPHGELVEPRTTVLPPQIKITPTYPRSPNLAYSSRVLSGGNASGNLRKSGKDRRFGFTGRKTCAAGRFGSMDAHWAKLSKTPGRVVPRIASIAYQNTQDPRSRDRPSFPPFNGQTQMRAWR